MLAIVFNTSANLVIKGFAAKQSETLLDLMTNIPLFIAAALFGINFIFYTKALSVINISIAYPIVVGFSIVLIIASSMLLFNERLSMVQSSGIGLIIVGIILIFYRM
jgi:multidrug transporter EmrE-like cation transporter